MQSNIYTKIATLIGFVALALGINAAHRQPATGFELSTYSATPSLFWVGSCFALLVSVLAVFSKPGKQMLLLSGLLGTLSMTAIVSLPIIRGYRYMGAGDSLSHLGTTADINAGAMLMTESRYPFVHTLGSLLHDATGLALMHTLLLLVVVFILTYFLFIPLAIRELTGNTTMTYIGLFSGLLLLPINHLSPSMYIHPTSQALMFAPVFFFTFFLLYRHRTWRLSLVFLTVATGFVILHPQQAANLLFFCVFVAAVQLGSHFYNGYRFSRYKEWVIPEVAIFAVAFWLWVRNLETFWSSLESVYMIPFEDTQAAETTATRSLSLTEVGGSLPEVFFKLFFVSLIFSLITVLFMIYVLSRQYDVVPSLSDSDKMTPDGGVTRTNLSYIFYGLSAIGLVFLIYLGGGISDQYFRQLGMLMVVVSILTSIALGRILLYISARRSEPIGRWAIGSFLLFCLVLSVPVVFASPYIYYSSDHITEMQMHGYETTFTHQSDSIAFDDIRSDTSRYGNAIQGRDIPSEAYYNREEPGIPDHFADRNLPAFYDESTYIPVTESDRMLDPILWRGFRFSHEDFAYLDGEPQINRVQTNGGYDLYLVGE